MVADNVDHFVHIAFLTVSNLNIYHQGLLFCIFTGEPDQVHPLKYLGFCGGLPHAIGYLQ